MHIETKCIHGGYRPENGEPRILPIYQSTTYAFDSAEHVGKLFDLTAEGHMYSRISNPTLECVEKKIAALEGGTGALLTSSGQAALLIAFLNLCGAGDHIVSAATIYGGATNLLAVTLARLGLEVTFVDPNAAADDIRKAFRSNTKALFGETLSNPALNVLDIEKFADIAHGMGVPLIVDNTFATPVLCQPFTHGADIVIHSTTKYMDGHAAVLGGAIVDGGTFDWTRGGFSQFTEPDESYHGVVYARDFGEKAFITKARVQLMRDLGAAPSPMAAFILNYGLETLHLRIERHCENALYAARFLEARPEVSWVIYPMLESGGQHDLVKKYLPKGCSGVLSFGLKGGRDAAVRFMDSLQLISIVVHVADVRTSILHPASTTHRQLNDTQLVEAGVSPELIRLSVGIENIDDITGDLARAFEKINS